MGIQKLYHENSAMKMCTVSYQLISSTLQSLFFSFWPYVFQISLLQYETSEPLLLKNYDATICKITKQSSLDSVDSKL